MDSACPEPIAITVEEKEKSDNYIFLIELADGKRRAA
jgi:hypothetical protein